MTPMYARLTAPSGAASLKRRNLVCMFSIDLSHRPFGGGLTETVIRHASNANTTWSHRPFGGGLTETVRQGVK